MSDLYAQFVNENERWIKQGSGATKEQLNGAAMYDAWLDQHAAPPPSESTQVDESGSSESSRERRQAAYVIASLPVQTRLDYIREVARQIGYAVVPEARAASPKGEPASAQAAIPAPEVVEALRRLVEWSDLMCQRARKLGSHGPGFCPVDRAKVVLAALPASAQAVAPGLDDVTRLARVLEAMKVDCDPDGNSAHTTCDHDEQAACILAAYAEADREAGDA